MSRRRIWLIIIGILMAGVSATWEMEKFVSSHGVNTAAVIVLRRMPCSRMQGNSRESLYDRESDEGGRKYPGSPECASSGVRPLPITGSPCTTRMQKPAGDRKMGRSF